MADKYSKYLPDLTQSWILIILLAIVGSLLGGVVTLVVKLMFPGFSGWGELIMYPLIFIPPFIAINLSIKNRPAFHSLPLNQPGFGKLGALLSILIIIPLVFTFNIVTEPLSMWMGVPEFLKQFMEQIQTNKISSLISVVILAPILEELFCRGIILRGLLTRMKPSKAIIWSAFMFGVMHMNPWQAIPAFLLGLLMGWIYYRTHSLWLAVLIHFINNGFSYFITVFYPQLPPDSSFYDLVPGIWYYIVYIFALAYTAAAFYLMNKYYDKTISIKIQPDS